MILPRRLLALSLLALACSSCLGAGHSVNAYAGVRSMDANDWDEVDEPTVYGVDGVLKVDLPFLGVEGGWFHSDDDSNASPEELTIDDYFVGLRLTPWKIFLEPYASIGITYVTSDIEDAAITDDAEETFAYYARLGAAFTLGIFRFGLDGRGLFSSDVDFDAIDTDLDNYQLTAFVGLGF